PPAFGLSFTEAMRTAFYTLSLHDALPISATLERAVTQWLEIVTANAENNNITCLLIHPTDTSYKLNAEERLLQACRQKSIYGSVDRKSTRLNSSHDQISYAVFRLKKQPRT